MITMGIDLGMKKIAVSLWEDDQLSWTSAYNADGYMPEVWEYLGAIARSDARKNEPDQIMIEDIIIGNNRKYSIGLAKTFGAVAAALNDHVVIPVNNKTWKKELLSNGNASKEQVRHYLTELDSAYSVVCGDDQDQYDAACIGYYGYILATRAASLSLADAR